MADRLIREGSPPSGLLASPVPQYWNPAADGGLGAYEKVQGVNGANRVLLWGSNNQPLLTETNAGYVRAADGALATIGALADAAQTSPTAEASVVALLKGVLTRLQAGADGAAPSDVVDRAARELGRISAVDGAIAALGTLADAAVTDPATSGAVIGLLKGLLQTLQGSPNVTLSGSNVVPIKRVITTTPLSSGGSYMPADLDLEATPIGLLSYEVASDTLVTLTGQAIIGGTARGVCAVTLVPTLGLIPGFRPHGASWRINVSNPTATDQTTLSVVEYLRPFAAPQPQNLRAVLAYGLEIRDTAGHFPSNDPTTMFRLVRIVFGGGKVPITVLNTHDQALSVQVRLAVSAAEVTLGTKSAPASTRILITNADFPGIDVPSEQISLILAASVAPTTGSVDAFIDTLVGGSA